MTSRVRSSAYPYCHEVFQGRLVIWMLKSEGESLQHTIAQMSQVADLAITSSQFEAMVGKDLHDE